MGFIHVEFKEVLSPQGIFVFPLFTAYAITVKGISKHNFTREVSLKTFHNVLIRKVLQQFLAIKLNIKYYFSHTSMLSPFFQSARFMVGILLGVISLQDVPLLMIRPFGSHNHPVDVLFTRLPVPPCCIRPSVVSEVTFHLRYL